MEKKASGKGGKKGTEVLSGGSKDSQDVQVPVTGEMTHEDEPAIRDGPGHERDVELPVPPSLTSTALQDRSGIATAHAVSSRMASTENLARRGSASLVARSTHPSVANLKKYASSQSSSDGLSTRSSPTPLSGRERSTKSPQPVSATGSAKGLAGLTSRNILTGSPSLVRPGQLATTAEPAGRTRKMQPFWGDDQLDATEGAVGGEVASGSVAGLSRISHKPLSVADYLSYERPLIAGDSHDIRNESDEEDVEGDNAPIRSVARLETRPASEKRPRSKNAPKMFATMLGTAKDGRRTPTSQRTPFPGLPQTPRSDVVALKRATKAEQLEKLRDFGRIISNKMRAGHRFAILTGPTGCGKSTILTHSVLMESLITTRPVFVTVPRRVACVRLAERMVSELLSVGHEAVWIGTRMRHDITPRVGNRLVFSTAGWLATKIIGDPKFIYSLHTLIFDEVHERNSQTDMAIGLVHLEESLYNRNLLSNVQTPSTPMTPSTPFGSPRVFPNIVCMSATCDPNELFKHFRPKSFWDAFHKKMPILADVHYAMKSVMNATFKVETMFLDDFPADVAGVAASIFPRLEGQSPLRPYLHGNVALAFFPVIETLATRTRYKSGCFLAFLPGVPEIQTLMKLYKDRANTAFKLIEFHGSMTKEALNLAQADASARNRTKIRVLLATNIAESSLTVDNLVLVIDFCLVKIPKHHEPSGCPMLPTLWTTEKMMIQRKGRVGRVCNGGVMYMTTKAHYEMNKKLNVDTPEILRVKLENWVLTLTAIRDSPRFQSMPTFVYEFVKTHLLVKPKRSVVQQATTNLLTSGCLIKGRNERTYGEWDNLQLTEQGRLVMRLEEEETISRLVCVGNLLMGQETAIIIASQLLIPKRDMFGYDGEFLEVTRDKLKWSDGVPSDELSLVNMFRAWRASTETFREDGGLKTHKDKQTYGRPREGETSDAASWEFWVADKNLFTKMADTIATMYATLKTIGLPSKSGIVYAKAKRNRAETSELEKIQADDRLLNYFMLALSLPDPRNWFISARAPGAFDHAKDMDLPLLNVLYVSPAPPLNMDLSVYGPVIQDMFQTPLYQYPSIEVDRSNNRMLLTYPPIPRQAYLGNVSESVFLSVIKFAKKKDNVNWHFKYLPGNDTTYDVKPQVSSRPLPYSDTPFMMSSFLCPHSFGVRLMGKETQTRFIALKHVLEDYKKVEFPFEKIALGTRCIVKISSARGSGDYNHTYKRAVIRCGHPTHLNEERMKPEEVLNHMVYVDCIDVGERLWVPLREMYWWDPEGPFAADLFDQPPCSYHVQLESIMPNPVLGPNWTRRALSWMSHILKDSQSPFRNLVKLQIEAYSEDDNIIVASDITQKDGNLSFCELCVEEGFAVKCHVALPFSQVIMNNTPSPDFLPRPTLPLVLPAPIEEWNEEKSESKVCPYRYCTIRDGNSPLEAIWHPVSVPCQGIRCCPSGKSINYVTLDQRLDGLLECTIYDPLLLLATEMTYRDHDEERKRMINLQKTTICPSIPSLPSLFAMLVFPVFQTVKDKYGAIFAVRIYKKQATRQALYAGSFPVTVVLDDEDFAIIKRCRKSLNDFFLCTKVTDLFHYRDDVLNFLKKTRKPLDYALPPTHDHIESHLECDIHTWIEVNWSSVTV